MCYVSRSSNNDWGWRIFALPTNDVMDDVDSLTETAGDGDSSAVVIVRESAHNQGVEAHTFEKISIPGAKQLEVLFHDKCATEYEVRDFEHITNDTVPECCFRLTFRSETS